MKQDRCVFLAGEVSHLRMFRRRRRKAVAFAPEYAGFRFVGVIRIPAEGESYGPNHPSPFESGRSPFESGQCHVAPKGTAPDIGATRRMRR